MADVGRRAGVSMQTVSRALNRPDEVSPETRDLVDEAIRATGYVQNLAASHLASNRSRTIAAILPAISTSVFSDTLRAATARFAPDGYQLMLAYTDYRAEIEEDLVRQFIQRRPDGFLVVGTILTDGAAKLLREFGRPVVETWDWREDPVDGLVGLSNRAAMHDMVQHLHRQGHRRIGFAGVIQPGDERAIQRLHGYRDALASFDPPEPERIIDLPDRSIDMDTGVALLSTALSRYPELTALVFPTDIFASAAILAAPRLGIAVPGRLSIVGFGDFEIARHLTPSLTTVAVDSRAIGERAADMLLARIAGSAEPGATVDVGFSIADRLSDGPPPD